MHVRGAGEGEPELLDRRHGLSGDTVGTLFTAVGLRSQELHLLGTALTLMMGTKSVQGLPFPKLDPSLGRTLMAPSGLSQLHSVHLPRLTSLSSSVTPEDTHVRHSGSGFI